MNVSKIGLWIRKFKQWIKIGREIADDVEDVIDESKQVIDRVDDLRKREEKDND
jgi:hypothetical protein